MKNLSLLLVVLCLTLVTPIFAQDELVLDPNQFINTQILGDTLADGSRAHSVYKLQRSTFYALDGRLDITFRCEIVGPDNGPIVRDNADGHPAVIVNTPSESGGGRDLFQILEGGELILKNVILSGFVSTGNQCSVLIQSNGGKLLDLESVVLTNFRSRAILIKSEGISVFVRDSVWMNGWGLDYNPWNGFVFRFEANGDTLLVENNTMVNMGRELCNAGPFLKMKTTLIHNTFIVQTKNAHELRHNEFISANNIFMNWDLCGHGWDEINEPDYYGMHFTTTNRFTPISDKLDSLSLYLGQNAFFSENAIKEWYATQDSAFMSHYWEFPNVDSCILADDNFTIGTNYKEFDPQFTAPLGNTDELVAYIEAYHAKDADRPLEVPDFRVQAPVEFPDGGAPVCNWPPQFDLSYSNSVLLTGGSDGLPVGDLNWFPEAKATYLANRDQFVAALRDSMANAKSVYVPGSPSPFITPASTAVEDGNVTAPVEFNLAQNYPNPFNPNTTIEYTIAKSGIVKIAIFNTLGQRVKTLVDTHQLSGKHTLTLNGKDLSSGIYFYSIKTGDFSQTKKMILMK